MQCRRNAAAHRQVRITTHTIRTTAITAAPEAAVATIAEAAIAVVAAAPAAVVAVAQVVAVADAEAADN